MSQNSSSAAKKEANSSPFATIRSSIRKLQSDSSLCDIFFQIDGANFDLHRAALFGLMGEYLSARLRSGMKGSGTSPEDRVVLNKFPGGPEVFKEVTRFCYFDENFEVDERNFVGLYYAAGYFNMVGEGNLLGVVASWWEDPIRENKEAVELLDLCQNALEFETQYALPHDKSVECFRKALLKEDLDENQVKYMAKSLVQKDRSLLHFLYSQNEAHRLSMENSPPLCDENCTDQEAYEAHFEFFKNCVFRKHSANLFAEVALQVGCSEEHTVDTDEGGTTDGASSSCEHPSQSGSLIGCPHHPESAKVACLNGLDYAWISPKNAYEVMKKSLGDGHNEGAKYKELEHINRILEGLNKSTTVPVLQAPGDTPKWQLKGCLPPYTALKFAQHWLKFTKQSNVRNGLLGGNASFAALFLCTMDNVLKILMCSLSSVLQAAREHNVLSEFSATKINYDYDSRLINPLERATRAFWDYYGERHSDEKTTELLNLLDVHIQSGFHPTHAHLNYILDVKFPVKHIAPYLNALLNLSASKDQGHNSGLHFATVYEYNQFFSKFEECPTYLSKELLQTLIRAGFHINELLLLAAYYEKTKVIDFLLEGGADPNFQMKPVLAKKIVTSVSDGYSKEEEEILFGMLQGSAALHLIFLLNFCNYDEEDEPDEDDEFLCFDQTKLSDLITKLLSAGADTSVVNSRGRTALQEFDYILEERKRYGWPIPNDECIRTAKALLSRPKQKMVLKSSLGKTVVGRKRSRS